MTTTHTTLGVGLGEAGVCTNPAYYSGEVRPIVDAMSESILERLPPALAEHATPYHRRCLSIVLRFIHGRPGPSIQEIVDNTPVGERKLRWMVKHLTHSGLVVEGQPAGPARRFFPAILSEPVKQRQAVALRDPDTARLHALLQTATWNQKGLHQEVEAWGWSRGKMRRHLTRLEDSGLLRRDGGSARFPCLRAVSPHLEVTAALRWKWANDEIGPMTEV